MEWRRAVYEMKAVCQPREGWKRIARSEARTMSGQPGPLRRWADKW